MFIIAFCLCLAFALVCSGCVLLFSTFFCVAPPTIHQIPYCHLVIWDPGLGGDMPSIFSYQFRTLHIAIWPSPVGLYVTLNTTYIISDNTTSTPQQYHMDGCVAICVISTRGGTVHLRHVTRNSWITQGFSVTVARGSQGHTIMKHATVTNMQVLCSNKWALVIFYARSKITTAKKNLSTLSIANHKTLTILSLHYAKMPLSTS